jgi:hypothetical protein
VAGLNKLFQHFFQKSCGMRVTIFRHFQGGLIASRSRALLVKIIVSSNAQARDRIIRATNNQSPVEISALHATDKIQRDIEEILERHSWYYERRRNYYRNIGKPLTRFVTPVYLASAAVALVLKNPSVATRIRARFMRDQESYDTVFSSEFPIEVWPVLVDIYKYIDDGLANTLQKHSRRELFVTTWRPLVALIVVARRLKTFAYGPKELTEVIGKSEITNIEVAEAWEIIKLVNKGEDRADKKRFKPALAKLCCNEAAKQFGISGEEEVGKRKIPRAEYYDRLPLMQQPAEFVAKVEALLPVQPWKPGLHIKIAKDLGCAQSMVSAAIQQLIRDGKRYVQTDGIVYDSSGVVIAVDPERVPIQSDLKGIGASDSTK